MFLWLANWWDGVDLWLSQLAFPFQFAVVIAVLAPFCVGVAWLVDRVVDRASGLGRTAEEQPAAEVGTSDEPPLVRADVPPGTPGRIISAVAPVPAQGAHHAPRRSPESAAS
ncbi:MAG TPA: hypothetical protein VFX16_02030 [Pseudonocardiaceae bacterium]|nr:hypothetical protein [Pseudonocardiaceae bacterium]